MPKFITAGEAPSYRPTAREITAADIDNGGISIGDQITTIEGDIANLQNDVTDLGNDVLTLQTDVANNSINITQNATDIANILNQIANGDFFATVAEVADQAARLSLPAQTDAQFVKQTDTGALYMLPAGTSPASNASWIEITGGAGGTTSDDITNASTVGGLTVTDALDILLTDLTAVNNDFVPIVDVGAPDGVAALGPLGTVPLAQLPPLPVVSVEELADEAARLAIAPNATGDATIVRQLDDDSVWVLPPAGNPTVPGNWVPIVDGGTGGSIDAASVTFDDTTAALGATNVQDAIEALDIQVDVNADAITILQNDVTTLVSGGPYIPTANAGAANGVAQLDGSGLVPLAQLPDLTGNKSVVADQAARLALPVDNDLQIAVQADTGVTYVLDAGADPSVDANWTAIATAPGSGGVDSFNGRIGIVVPSAGDYDATLIGFTSGAGLVSTQVAAALDELAIGKSNVGHGHQAFEIVLDTFAFDGPLSGTDVNVQIAMETIDDYIRVLDSGDVGNASTVAGTTVTDALDSLRASLISFSGDYLLIANNLSEIPDAAAARANLGLGTAATADLGDFLTALVDDLTPTLGGDLIAAGFSAQQLNLIGPTERELASDIAGTFDFDYRVGTFRKFTLTNNVTINSIAEPASDEATTVRFFFRNPSSFTVDFTSNNGLVTFAAPGGELFSLPANAPFVVPDNSILILDYSGTDQSWRVTEGGEDFQTV